MYVIVYTNQSARNNFKYVLINYFIQFNIAPLNDNDMREWHFNIWPIKGSYKFNCLHGIIIFTSKYPHQSPIVLLHYFINHPNVVIKSINNNTVYHIRLNTLSNQNWHSNHNLLLHEREYYF